jgi:hypothetical protein
MRHLLAAAVLILVSASGAVGAEMKFVRVWSSFRTADSFMRISEYFTGRENPGRGQTVLRTQPANRAGYYFLARVKNSGEAVEAAKLALHIITPDSPLPKVYRFDTPVPRGEHVFNLGLTGADWRDAETFPVAWRLVLLGPDGGEITAEQSFLWSKPDQGEVSK